MSQGAPRRPYSAPILNKSTTHPKHMEDTLWTEIADAPGEIFDISELMDLEEDYQTDEATWNAFLNSNWDF